MLRATSFFSKNKTKKNVKLTRLILVFFSLLIILLLAPYLFYNLNFVGRIYPNIYVSGVNVGGMTNSQAFQLLSNSASYPKIIKLNYEDRNFEINADEVDLRLDYAGTVIRAYNLVRTGNFVFDFQQRVRLLFYPTTIGYLLNLDHAKLDQNIKTIASQIDIEPVEARFRFDGNKVSEFQTSSNGRKVDQKKIKNMIIQGLASFEIPVDTIYPNVTTDNVNNLGIKELIGTGSSTYFHSIPGRAYNVNLAASRINGTLVAPGEIFSFNKTLGDVSKFTGYKEAYIIQNGRTVLGDGGGVCQVSTTLFRAVLNTGLPVNERSAHAYRVGYYEQNSPPGIDATVYGPSPDFKFTNDTNNYILIVAQNNPANYSLSFYLYGTKDNRIATVSKSVLSNYSAPLPTIYQDDPTLPNGTLKQIDFAAAGARVSFDYVVQKDEQIVYQKTFVSNYQPWAAVYLRGTATK
jgi:vancomycin resistance protein YoaR